MNPLEDFEQRMPALISILEDWFCQECGELILRGQKGEPL